MNSQSSKHQELSLAPTRVSSSDSPTMHKIGSMPAGRLIVLVPPASDYGITTQRIWEVAIATGRHIQLLSLCKDIADEPSLHRQLVLMSALLGDGRISTEAKVEMGMNWVDAVKRNYQTGDIIVCYAEQHDGFLNKPLNQILEENLDSPILILGGLYPERPSRPNLLLRVSLWVGVISIITGAFLLQIRITSLPRDWPQTTLLILSVIVEFWLIWVWNKLFS